MSQNLKICTEFRPLLVRYGVEGAFKHMKNIGFDGVDFSELSYTELDLWKLDEEGFKKELTHIKDLALAEGLEIFQTHAPWRFPPRDYTEEDRAERFEKFSKAIRGTAYLGSHIMVVHCIMPYGAQACDDHDEFMRLNTKFYSKLAKEAQKYNVEIHVETLPFPKLPINNAQQCVDFARHMNEVTGTDLFRVCLDTGHCNFCGEDPADAVRIIGGEMLGSLHVHDNDGHADQHRIPGNGTINWEAFSDAIQEVGYKGYFDFETYIPRDMPNGEDCERAERELVLLGHKLAKNN